jgi:hypothetical protein
MLYHCHLCLASYAENQDIKKDIARMHTALEFDTIQGGCFVSGTSFLWAYEDLATKVIP